MWQKNNGHSESDVLQNRFTAYISVAIKHRRRAYVLQAIGQQQLETLTENPVSSDYNDILEDVMSELPILMQLENEMLLHALKELDERERQILFARVLNEKSFAELANEFGLGYKGVAAVYYRALHKIRNRMKEVENEF